MKGSRIIVCLALVSMIAAGAFATPIAYISATTVPTTFTPGDGINPGTLVLSGVRPLVIHATDGSQSTIADVTYSLTTSLKEDNSTGGVVKGVFEGGELTLTDSLGGILFSGSIVAANLEEMPEGSVVLIASGPLGVTGGSLKPDFGASATMYDLIFTTEPMVIDDLSGSFSGFSDITVAPIPEPLTLTLLGLGLAGIVAARRKR